MTFDSNRAEALTHMAVSHETAARLDVYVDLLLRWQQIKNLVAPSTLGEIWTRHIADSAQLLPLLGRSRTIVDIGSGAGFPGLVLAIVKSGEAGFHVHLVESNGRKAAFLREVVRATEAPATVHGARIEDFTRGWRGDVDFLTARALASLGDLLAFGESLFDAGSRALFLKGQSARQELADASEGWNIDAKLYPSVTDSSGQIILINSASRRNGVRRLDGNRT